MKQIAIILTGIFISLQLYAVDIVNGTSPTKDVTTMFNEPVDQYLDSVDFKDLDSSVLFLQLGMPGSATPNSFQIGTGTQLNNSLYLAGDFKYKDSGSNFTLSEELGSSSIILTDSYGLYSGHYDEIISTNISQGGLYLGTNLLAGLNIGALKLGITGKVFYDDNAIIGTMFDTGFGLASQNNIVKTSYTNDGIKTFEDSVIYSADGYDKAGTSLKYGIGAGTSLNLGRSILDIKLNVNIDNVDNSTSTGETTFTTLFDTELPTYNGVEGATDYSRTINNQIYSYNNIIGTLSVNSLYYIASNKFILEPGLDYTPNFKLYQDGGYSISSENNTYSAEHYNNVYIKTTNTDVTSNYKAEISESGHSISIPFAIKSNYDSKFNFGIKNILTYNINTANSTSQNTSSTTTAVDSTDPSFDNTNTTTEMNGQKSNVDTVSTNIFNMVNVAAQFYFTDKLRVNLGSTVTINPYSVIDTTNSSSGYDTTTTIVETNDVVTSEVITPNYTLPTGNNSKSSSVKSTTTTSASYQAGLTYFFNQFMTLDLEMQGSGDIFTSSTWSLFMTIKY